MFMRILQLKIDPRKKAGFRRFYNDTVVPALQKVDGCLSMTLVQQEENSQEFLSVTLWDKEENAEAYNQSELFQHLLAETKLYFQDSSEWKIQLSEDYTLALEPAEDEPIVNSLPVVVQSDTPVLSAGDSQMFMRILSVRILPDKMDEVKQFYGDEIIPALKKIAGCRYAYLSESVKEENELFSLTIWDSKNDAENYEKSGLFDEFMEKLKHTFSAMNQWKMILDTRSDEKNVADRAVDVNYYNVVSGRRF